MIHHYINHRSAIHKPKKKFITIHHIYIIIRHTSHVTRLDAHPP